MKRDVYKNESFKKREREKDQFKQSGCYCKNEREEEKEEEELGEKGGKEGTCIFFFFSSFSSSLFFLLYCFFLKTDRFKARGWGGGVVSDRGGESERKSK